MKKLLIPVLALVPIGAGAITTLQGCSSVTCPTSVSATVYEVPHPSCDSYTTKCLYNSATGFYLRYRTCDSCDSPYESITERLSSFTAFTTVCGSGSVVLSTRTNCSCGTQCDDCGSSLLSQWTGTVDAYETRTVYNCGISTSCECQRKTEARCRAGYYGSVSVAGVGVLNNCKRCPSSGGVYGTSVAGNGTAITSCYIPTTSMLTDDAGAYQYTSNCYYSE